MARPKKGRRVCRLPGTCCFGPLRGDGPYGVVTMSVEELEAIRDTYDPMALYEANPRLRRVVDSLIDGTVPTDDEFRELHDSLLQGASWHKADHYYLLKDFDSYQEARLRANRDYRDRLAFGKKCLLNVASAGKFSSDRTIRQYAQEIWHV